MAYRSEEAPKVTIGDGFGNRVERRTTHPSYAVCQVNRVSSTGVTLFDSNVRHDGFIVMSFSEAEKVEDGYSSNVRGHGREIFEVAMTENQFVAIVTRMNHSGGTPVTLQHRQTGPLSIVPSIAGFESTDEQLRRMADEIDGQVREEQRRRVVQLKGMLEGLPKKKAAEIESLLDLIINQSISNLDYGRTVLTEHAEKKITEAKVEVDAHITGVVTQLGVQSLQELTKLSALTLTQEK